MKSRIAKSSVAVVAALSVSLLLSSCAPSNSNPTPTVTATQVAPTLSAADQSVERVAVDKVQTTFLKQIYSLSPSQKAAGQAIITAAKKAYDSKNLTQEAQYDKYASNLVKAVPALSSIDASSFLGNTKLEVLEGAFLFGQEGSSSSVGVMIKDSGITFVGTNIATLPKSDLTLKVGSNKIDLSKKTPVPFFYFNKLQTNWKLSGVNFSGLVKSI